MNYPSFLMTMSYDYMQENYKTVSGIGLAITVFVLALWMVWLISKKPVLSYENFILIALMLTYTTVFFLPAMHDRYGFVYEILAILYMFKNKKAIIPGIVLMLISVATYSNFLFHVGIDLRVLTAFNFFTYAYYAYITLKGLRADS